MREDGISEAFPNVDTAFRLAYLTLPVANTEGETSFSVLERVKNQLRSTIFQHKQCNLSFLTIQAPKSSHITPILRSLHWLKINELLSLTYKVFTTNQPDYLHNL